jgi:C1A family cysteine protease
MIPILHRLFAPKTTFKAGGLRLDVPYAHHICLSAPSKFMAPRSLDFRDMCIATSDQGATSQCAGYATAGMLEVQNWKRDHYPEQVSGTDIYNTAKKLDSLQGEGTTLFAAAKAAQVLGLTKGEYYEVRNTRNDLKFVIHQNCVCSCGFKITDEWNYAASNGTIPDWKDKATTIGGHAVLCCGYNQHGVYIQNSWGSKWGLYGFGFLSWPQFDRQFISGVVIK